MTVDNSCTARQHEDLHVKLTEFPQVSKTKTNIDDTSKTAGLVCDGIKLHNFAYNDFLFKM